MSASEIITPDILKPSIAQQPPVANASQAADTAILQDKGWVPAKNADGKAVHRIPLGERYELATALQKEEITFKLVDIEGQKFLEVASEHFPSASQTAAPAVATLPKSEPVAEPVTAKQPEVDKPTAATKIPAVKPLNPNKIITEYGIKISANDTQGKAIRIELGHKMSDRQAGALFEYFENAYGPQRTANGALRKNYAVFNESKRLITIQGITNENYAELTKQVETLLKTGIEHRAEFFTEMQPVVATLKETAAQTAHTAATEAKTGEQSLKTVTHEAEAAKGLFRARNLAIAGGVAAAGAGLWLLLRSGAEPKQGEQDKTAFAGGAENTVGAAASSMIGRGGERDWVAGTGSSGREAAR